MKSKATAFKQTTDMIKFLYDLINSNGRNTPKDIKLINNKEYVADIDNFDRTQQWLNYCKFVMMFSRDNKRAYLDDSMVSKCIDGHFEGVSIDKKGDTYSVLRKYNLDDETLTTIRKALMFYANAKDKAKADAEFRNKYKNCEFIYDFIKFVPNKGYEPVGKINFELDSRSSVVATTTDAVGIKHVITYDANGNVQVDFFTKPLVLRRFDGSVVDDKSYYGLRDGDLINFVRNVIAHNKCYYVAKEGCLRTNPDEHSLTVDIPLGWLVQLCNFYVTNTFANINVVNPRYLIQNRQVSHKNNQFVLQFYPNMDKIDTFEDVVKMLENRVSFVITVDDNAKYYDVKQLLDKVYRRYASKDITQMHVANAISKDVVRLFNNAGLSHVKVDTVKEPLDQTRKDFWNNYLHDCYIFFKDNMGDIPTNDMLMKHMTESIYDADEYQNPFQDARTELVMAALRLMDDECMPVFKKWLSMYADLSMEEKGLSTNEKAFKKYLQQHYPEHYDLWLKHEEITNRIVLEATLQMQIIGKGQATNYFEPVQLLSEEISAKYKQVIKDYLATVPTRTQIKDQETKFLGYLKKVPRSELAEYHSLHVKVESELAQLSKNYEIAKYFYGLMPTDDNRDSLMRIKRLMEEKEREDNKALDKLMLKLQEKYPEVYYNHKELVALQEAQKISVPYAKALKFYEKQEKEFQDALTYRRFEIVWNMEEARHNNISGLMEGGTNHISTTTMLNLFDIINNLGFTASGDRISDHISITKTDLETLLTNKRESSVALAIYQVYSALVETGYEQLLEESYYSGQVKDDRHVNAVERLKKIDMSPIKVTYGNTTRQLDDLDQRRAIIFRMRSALVHGNVTIKDYYDYKDDPKDIMVCFNKDKYNENDYDMTVECSVGDLIKVFSKEIFEPTLETTAGSAKIVYDDPIK